MFTIRVEIFLSKVLLCLSGVLLGINEKCSLVHLAIRIHALVERIHKDIERRSDELVSDTP